MSGWIESLNAHSADWAAWMWRICWQAAIVIAVAWLLTILLRSQSPRLRSWIWRLAYLKLLVLLVWTTPVQLPLLPAQEGSGFGVQGSAVESQESGVGSQFHTAATAGREETQSVVTNKADVTPFSRDPKGSTEPVTESASRTETNSPTVSVGPASATANLTSIAGFHWQSLLLISWLVGILLVITWLAWETARAAKLRRSVRLVNQPELQTILAEVCQQLSLRTKVQIGESNLAGSPLLVKFLKPTIVFPPGVLLPLPLGEASASSLPLPQGEGRGEGALPFDSALSPDELRLVLAHELAHLKRHDLAWNALSAVVHVLLYFHPLVWLAHRLARQEQEMSCDELVVTRLGVQRHEYGQMLVKVVRRLGRNFPTGMAVVGMASFYQRLSKRIEAMKRFRQFTRRQIALAAFGLALIGLLAIIPWQVVAQEAKSVSDLVATPLADAVKTFNAQAANDPLGKSQPPLTENEVVAAIRGWPKGHYPPASDKIYNMFQQIAETKQLPAKSTLKFMTKWTTDDQEFDVWWVDLDISTGPNSGYTFRIRDIKLGVKKYDPHAITKAENDSIPNTVVSDAPQSDTSPQANSASEPAPTADQSATKKLLVGTWNNNNYYLDELVLRDDGTFERMFRDWDRHPGPATTKELNDGPKQIDHYQRGNWTVAPRKIGYQQGEERTVDALNLEVLHDDWAQPLWKKSNTHEYAKSWYSIERLDKDLLRLTNYDGKDKDFVVRWISDSEGLEFKTTPTLFYRRVEPQSYDPKLAEDVRRLAALAQLMPKQASDFYRIANSKPPEGLPNTIHELLDPARVDLIERIDAARHHKIDFAQLFGLNAAETDAFRDLMRLVDGHYETANLILDQGNLSGAEESAMKKLNAMAETINFLGTAANNDGTAFGDKHNPAAEKVSNYISGLGQWLDIAVYGGSMPHPNPPSTGGGFGGGGF